MAGAARSHEEDQRLRTPKTKLTDDDREVIRGMLGRGDRIQDVAYWWGVSPATVHGIKKRGGWWACASKLPPPGPYALVRRVEVSELEVRRRLVEDLQNLLDRYRAELSELATVHNGHAALATSDCDVSRAVLSDVDVLCTLNRDAMRNDNQEAAGAAAL